MENFSCPICNQKVSIESEFHDNNWSGIWASCNDMLARCPCGKITENYSIVPLEQVMANCTNCGRQSYQDDSLE